MFNEKTQRFEALGSFDDLMKSLAMHASDPNPEVALRSRMLMGMLPSLHAALEEEARRKTEPLSIAMAGLDVVTNFITHMIRGFTADEKEVPKAMRIFGKSMQDNMRRAAQQVEEHLRGASGPKN